MEFGEKRAEPRIKRRIACELTVGERRFSGLVLDISRHGLFVQTAARPDPQDAVRVSISVPGSREPLLLDAVVRRARLVPPQLRTVAQGGVGLHVPDPSEAYLRFVENVGTPAKIEKVSVLPGGSKAAEAQLTRERLDRFFAAGPKRRASAPPVRAPEPEEARPPELPSWRLELRHAGAGGHRSLLVRSRTEAEARAQVEAEIEEGWKIERIWRAG